MCLVFRLSNAELCRCADTTWIKRTKIGHVTNQLNKFYIPPLCRISLTSLYFEILVRKAAFHGNNERYRLLHNTTYALQCILYTCILYYFYYHINIHWHFFLSRLNILQTHFHLFMHAEMRLFWDTRYIMANKAM